eukprot:Rhum_TRINITY_DN8357_c0_g1::Rhum_TRINITY_DN8357_c0_g1_i1::g.27219::m.27219
MRRVVLRSAAAARTPSAATTLLSTPPLFLRRASSSSSAQTDSLNEQTLRDAADAAVQVAAVERALRKRTGCPDADAAAAEKVDVPATAAEDEAAPLVLLGGDEAAAGAAETEAVPSSEAEAQDDMAYVLRRASDLRALHERRALAVGKRARALLELEMLCLVEGKVDVAAVAARIAAEEAAEKEEGKKKEEEEVDEGELFFGLGGDEHGAGASVEEAAQRAREHELERGCDQSNQRRNPAASAAKLQKTFRMRSQAGRVEDSEMYMREDRGGTVETLEATASLAGKTTRGRRAEYSSTLDIESVLEQAAHQSKRSDEEEASKLRFMTDVVVPNLETELRGKFPQASPELIHKLALELAEKRLAKTRDNIGGGMW